MWFEMKSTPLIKRVLANKSIAIQCEFLPSDYVQCAEIDPFHRRTIQFREMSSKSWPNHFESGVASESIIVCSRTINGAQNPYLLKYRRINLNAQTAGICDCVVADKYWQPNRCLIWYLPVIFDARPSIGPWLQILYCVSCKQTSNADGILASAACEINWK